MEKIIDVTPAKLEANRQNAQKSTGPGAGPSLAGAGDLSHLGNGEKSPAKPEVRQDRASGSERVNVLTGTDEGCPGKNSIVRRGCNTADAKLEANRQNAQKSTGPKTPEGKAAAKMNALKHGYFAQSVVVQGCKFKESSHDFKQLCADFYAALAPVGPLEESLVDQIIQAMWRQRRLRAAEAGEIALRIDDLPDPTEHLKKVIEMPPPSPMCPRLETFYWGCTYIIHSLQHLRDSVKSEGELTEAALDDYRTSLRSEFEFTIVELDKMYQGFVSNPEELEPDVLRKRHQADVLKYVDKEINRLEYLLPDLKKNDELTQHAQQSAALLPSAGTVRRILRYENALERQYYRAINQLERLQRRRLGDNVHPPVSVDVSRSP